MTDSESCNEISLFTKQLILDKGYPLEIHHVKTEDSYINSLYRIPHGVTNVGSTKSKPPVLLVHGLMSSVAESVLEDRHLGYYLADLGFDVWIANCRGTTYSRQHKKYDHVEQPDKYWNFSFHEIGYYDHPAFIDYILKETSFKKVTYIGISQGCTTLAVLLSTRLEYNEKIALACLLCPAIEFENAKPFPMRFLFCFIVPWLKWFSEIFHTPLFQVPFAHWLRHFGRRYSKPDSYAASFIEKVWDFMAGHSNPEKDQNIDIAKISMTTPNTACFKQLLHFSQVMSENKFARYDYGSEKNMKIYGYESPPVYDISKVTAPVAIFYSKNDMYYGTQKQLILDKGYPLEIHHVTTEDSYINSLYRIPHGLTNIGRTEPNPPVLLVHGLLSSVAESVLEDRHLGYYLADLGFDVWMANCRGTTYSREHKKYDHVEQPDKYWNFSFHEIGYYDHPAFIDYILKETSFKKVTYIGISQGCTTLAVLLSTRPEYNEKIASACLLCPGIQFENAKTFPITVTFRYGVPWIKWLSDTFHIPLFQVSFTNWVRYFGRRYAKPGSYAASLIKTLWDLMAGHSNPEKNNKIDFSKISMTTPNTACFKQMVHFSQVLSAKKFARYDYGSEKNMKIYGNESPPVYDMSMATAPVAIFYSKNDMYYGTQDIDAIAAKFGNCIEKHLVKHDYFNHFDFIYNENVIELLYVHIYNIIKKYVS